MRPPALSCYRDHLLNGSCVPSFRTPTEFQSTLGRFATHKNLKTLSQSRNHSAARRRQKSGRQK
jgi:hypothetical protein